MIDIPTVKRHSVDGYGRQDICYNDPNGEFVYYDDYFALWQELKNLRAEAQRLKSTDQILRPVELPGLKVCSNDHAGSQLWIESQVWNKAIDACAEALGQQGYEVKP